MKEILLNTNLAQWVYKERTRNKNKTNDSELGIKPWILLKLGIKPRIRN